MALTTLGGCTFLFLFGLLVGRLTEPVPGLLGGVSALWWLAPALVVVAAMPPLVTCQRALSRQRPAVDRAPAVAAAVSIGSTSTSEGLGSALDLFPTEALTPAR